MTRARLLTPAEELRLAKRIERGDLRAKERMIESNLRLVVAVANAHRSDRVPFADLVQEGTIGLVRAVEKFDHRRGLKFSTYAIWWIRRSILDAIANAGVIRIPGKARRQLAAVLRAEAELERPVSDVDIAQRTRMSVSTVHALRTAARVTASLDDPAGDDGRAVGDLLADERAADPSETAIEREDRREVARMLRLLPERQREVLTRRYGLAQTYEEIGESLGVGPERSRQIEHDALRRLRSVA